jgi:hypothetical protein
MHSVNLTCLSQFATFARRKCFRISKGTQKVFTTKTDYSGVVGANCEDLMRGGG